MVEALEVIPRVGIREATRGQKNFAPIARLAETLRQAKLTNWAKVFALPASAYIYRVGKGYRGILNKFKGEVIASQPKLINKKSHTIEVASYGKTTYYKRKVYIVDGIPVVFINPEANKKMELLLRGNRLSIEKRSRIAIHIRREVDFLNKYFGLAIDVYQKPDDGGSQALHFRMQKELRLIVRETTMPVR